MKLKPILLTLGVAMLLSAGTAQAVPISYLGVLNSGIPVNGINNQISGNSSNPVGADYWRFNANVGDSIDVIGDRLIGHYDMSFYVFQGVFADTNDFGPFIDSGDLGFIAFGDDQDPPNIPGPFGDPHVTFIAPSTGSYTIIVTNFASNGEPPNPYQLVERGSTATVPEPAALQLLGTGLAALAAFARRRR